jgi:hypothetical protein
MTIAIERRLSPRHPAVENVALVEFKTRRKTRTVGASLIDVSATGALLRMREKPRVDGLLWVRLAYPVRTPALLASAVRIDEEGRVGVEFVRACNRTFYWTATRGVDFREPPLERFAVAEAVRPWA